MAQVVEINDPAELSSYRLLWTKLYSETAGASFFHSLDWLETYWRHYGDRQRLRVLVVYAAESPIGILPLVVRRETTRLGTVRVLTYPLADWGSFYGPIGSTSDGHADCRPGACAATEADWDLIDLRWIDGTEACDRTLRAMEIRGFSATTAVWAKSAQVELDGDMGHLLGRPQAHLAEERALCREAAGDCTAPVEFLRFRPRGAAWGDGDPYWPLYDECEIVGPAQLARKLDDRHHLVARGGATVLRAAHEAAAHAGAADVSLLSVGGVPVAFAYCYQSAGYVYGLRMGFDAEQAHEGAGTVLHGTLDRRQLPTRRPDRRPGKRISRLQAALADATGRKLPRDPFSLRAEPKAQALRLKRWLAGIRHRRD